MIPIATADEYYQIITTVPYSIMIFSSTRTCHPCKLLSKWIEDNYPDEPHIYYVNVLVEELDSICINVSALPTMELYCYTEVMQHVKGFQPEKNKAVIEEAKSKRALISALNEPRVSSIDDL